MTIDHDAIAARVRQNREAGTPGPWALSASGYNVMRGKTAATVAVAQPSDFSLSDARRISALPDLEAAYLALYDEVKRLRAERDALRAALETQMTSALRACWIVDQAAKAGHTSLGDLVNDLLEAVTPARQALNEQPNE